MPARDKGCQQTRLFDEETVKQIALEARSDPYSQGHRIVIFGLLGLLTASFLRFGIQ